MLASDVPRNQLNICMSKYYDEVEVLAQAYKKLDDLELKVSNVKQRIFLMQMAGHKHEPVVTEPEEPVYKAPKPEHINAELDDLRRKLMPR